MAKKQMLFKTKGMNRDLSVSAFNPEFAFENINLRLSTNEGNTMLSWVNEKGTERVTFEAGSPVMLGYPIGTAILNDQLVVFTTTYTEEDPNSNPNSNQVDRIYLLEFTDSSHTIMRCRELCVKALNFSTLYPLETLSVYESESIKKVYWTDGRNQPRVINIADSNLSTKPNTYFDFIPTLNLREVVTVESLNLSGGVFAPGVIQYAFTYFNKNGQESNIFYTTPLHYIAYNNRGASPEDKVECAFKITVNNIDSSFDYLRIYSIQRTSINGTPICKRLQDVSLREMVNNNYVSYIDTGVNGNIIDPTELLFKGGETITAKTMTQKDNTLFLGNLKIKRLQLPSYKSAIAGNVAITPDTRAISVANNSCQLQATAQGTTSLVPCGGFKTGNYYRLGIQLQHESGKWSAPIHISNNSTIDFQQTGLFSINGNTVTLPIFKGIMSNEPVSIGDTTVPLFTLLANAGYKRVRPLVVFPKGVDRNVVFQSVGNVTVNFPDRNCFYSSWFFRPRSDNNYSETDTVISPYFATNGTIHYSDGGTANGNPSKIRMTEIEGTFYTDHKVRLYDTVETLHSPDLEFSTDAYFSSFNQNTLMAVGKVRFTNTRSDMDIQLETPTLSNDTKGFAHSPSTSNTSKGIVSGLFFEDYVVDDYADGSFGKMEYAKSAARWLVYPWQGSGSMNNDIKRPEGKGTQTAILKKKVISNHRKADTTIWGINDNSRRNISTTGLQLFSSEEPTIVKVGTNTYSGVMDTTLIPDKASGVYLAWNELIGYNNFSGDLGTPLYSDKWIKTLAVSGDDPSGHGLYKWYGGESWGLVYEGTGKFHTDIVMKKKPVRMRYKSTPHVVAAVGNDITNIYKSLSTGELPIIEVQQNTSSSTRFGGYNPDALTENTWIPCGEPVTIPDSGSVAFYYSYGDTYFQRYECLKTYAYSPDDINQVVEIGSFMLETYQNIDGRYDRNREQWNNLNMSPRNFNLWNPVYSQVDNFFSYKIMPDDNYTNINYPNKITWSKSKESGEDVDTWTNVTLASILELDGDKGEVNKLERHDNQIICFQDTGISQILYNENTQISTTEGVPVEIANSGKVQGKRYISNTIGCSNKWSVVTSPNGIYFMDSNDKSIYLYNGQLQNISATGGFNSWCKQNIPTSKVKWNPVNFGTQTTRGCFKSVYDKQNQEILFVSKDTALAYSEKFGVFTSFYSYGGVPYFCNLCDAGLWLRPEGETVKTRAWRHQYSNDYCKFFDTYQPYSMTLVGNPEPTVDKIFTNLEFTACVEGEGLYQGTFDETFDYTFDHSSIYTAYLPFDRLLTWNEYQEGEALLNTRMGHDAFMHHVKNQEGVEDQSSLKRKFRIWRCDIPRDKTKRLDRMRNPWLYLKLQKDIEGYQSTGHKTEIHNIIMTYFG